MRKNGELHKFKYKFTKVIICLFAVCLVCAIFMVVFSILRTGKPPFDSYKIFSIVSSLIIGAFALVFFISVIVNSYFGIDDKNLILNFGFLKNVIPLKDITRLVKMQESNKLIVYYEQEKYYVVYISQSVFDDFTKCLVEKNKNVIVEFTNG